MRSSDIPKLILMPERFVAAFGCDYKHDMQTASDEFIFHDETGNTTTIWIGIVDNTCTISLNILNKPVFKCSYDRVHLFTLDESEQSIKIVHGNENDLYEITFKAWPNFEFQFNNT